MQAEATVEHTLESLNDLAGKYLTFRLGEEDYGLEILKVQ
jgi:chemotaxis signal transduction protein